MDFCVNCDMMLYLSIDNDEETNSSVLKYECKKCKTKYSDTKDIKNNCVYKVDYDIDEIKRDSIINKYTSLDITLPRINNIPCPNAECTTANPEIVYLKYDDEKMKFCYVCCECQKANRKFYWFLD